MNQRNLFSELEEIPNEMLENFSKHYDWYIQHSQQWQETRQRIFARDGGICQFCYDEPATQAHHLTYKRLGREDDEDLLSVCYVCHQSGHDEGGVWTPEYNDVCAYATWRFGQEWKDDMTWWEARDAQQKERVS
jgi:5-methylcytosine-specific restriction endonuclease McrA